MSGSPWDYDVSSPARPESENIKTKSWSFMEDLVAGDEEEEQSVKRNSHAELMNSFLVPFELERVLSVICLVLTDHLLHLFCVVPLRLLILIPISVVQGSLSKRRLFDLLKILIICLTTYLLSFPFFDFGVAYHNVKGQSTLKIYVIYNILEVVDKIVSCFGNDIFDLLRASKTRLHLVAYAFVAFVYSIVHAVVMFYQAVTLSVAINFNSSFLITVLTSNNFVELKSQIYKRVSPANLAQLIFGDGVERMQIIIMLLLITVHNFSDINWDLQAFWINHTLTFLGLVFLAEVVTDWMKHVFVCKFNSLSATWYREGTALVLRDALNPAYDSGTNLENASRRLGFVDVPYAVMVLKFLQEAGLLRWMHFIFIGLWVVRLVVHNILFSYFGARASSVPATPNQPSLSDDLQRNQASSK